MTRSAKGLMLSLALVGLATSGCATLEGASTGINLGCVTGAAVGGAAGCAVGAPIGAIVGSATGAAIDLGITVAGKTTTTSRQPNRTKLPPERWREFTDLTRDEIAQRLKAERANDPSYEPSPQEIDEIIARWADNPTPAIAP